MVDKNSTNNEHTTDPRGDASVGAGDVTGGAAAPAAAEEQGGATSALVLLDRPDTVVQGGDGASLYAPTRPIPLEALVIAAQKASADVARELEADRAEDGIELTLDVSEPVVEEIGDDVAELSPFTGVLPARPGAGSSTGPVGAVDTEPVGQPEEDYTDDQLLAMLNGNDPIAEEIQGTEALGGDDAKSSPVAEVPGTLKSDAPSDAPSAVGPVQAPMVADREGENQAPVPAAQPPDKALESSTSPEAPDEGLFRVNWNPNHDRRTGWISVRTHPDDILLHSDSGDIGSEEFRDKFLRRCQEEYPHMNPKEVNSMMLKIVSSTLAAEAKDTVRGPEGEIKDTVSARPELVIIPELTSITISVMWQYTDKVGPMHLMYAQHPDGRRECIVQDDLMEFDRVKLLHSSGSGNVTDLPEETWRPESRKDWLEGKPAPDPGLLYTGILKQMNRYIYVSKEREGVLPALAIWTMLSYAYAAWLTVPYLHLTGPWGSGKTQILDVLKRMVFRPFSSSNTTAATMFHSLNSRGGTLLLDEAERLSGKSQDTQQLLSILLSGYRRGEQATRVAGRYHVFGPKAVACIKNIPPPLLSRCIPIEMTRAPLDADQIQRQIAGDAETWMSLRDNLYEMAVGYGATFLDLAQRSVGDWLTGRQHDVWQPMLSFASWIEGHGVSGLRATMERMAKRLIETEAASRSLSADEVLLRALAEFSRQGVTVTTKQVLEVAQKQAPVLLSTYSARKASSCLDKYGLKTSPSNGRNVYRPTPIGVFLKIQQQYGLDLGLEPPAPSAATDNSDEEPDDGSERVA